MARFRQQVRSDAALELTPACSMGSGPCNLTLIKRFSHRRPVSLPLGSALLLSLSACAPIEQRIEPYLIRDWAEIWFGISFLLWLGLGLLMVRGLLWHALSKWNLAGGVPRTRPAFYILVASAILCPVAFALMNFLWDGPIPPEQRFWNSVGWAVGSAVGAIGAWQGGKRLVAQQYRKKFPVRTRENS